MREAVIVSYARTGLAKAARGGFNITPPMTMAAHAIKHSVERAPACFELSQAPRVLHGKTRNSFAPALSSPR